MPSMQLLAPLGVAVCLFVSVLKPWKSPGSSELNRCPAELRGPRSRVLFQLSVVRDHRPVADIRVNSRPQTLSEGFLNPAVLSAVKTDDGGSCPRLHDIGQNRQQTVQIGQFAIDHNAQRQERSRSRVEFGTTGTFDCEVARLADDAHQLL